MYKAHEGLVGPSEDELDCFKVAPTRFAHDRGSNDLCKMAMSSGTKHSIMAISIHASADESDVPCTHKSVFNSVQGLLMLKEKHGTIKPVAFAKRLLHIHSPDPHRCVPVVKRVQQHSKPPASLSPQYPREPASVPRALRIVPHVVAVVSPENLQRQILLERLHIH
jgi:hypothetical protein